MYSPKPGFLFCCLILSFCCRAQLDWPAIQQQTKPWARWWWQGSAVDRKGLDSNLRLYQNAGLGGLEITPIYGVQGKETSFVPYLSQQWLGLLEHTLATAANLGLGIDMANGTGWPFGGPWVTEAHASKTMATKVYVVREGDSLTEPVCFWDTGFVRTANNRPLKEQQVLQPLSANTQMQKLAIDQLRFSGPLQLEVLMAYPGSGKALDLTKLVDSTGKLHWKAPPGGGWNLYALFSGLHGKLVERAAPGGEGYAIDHFSGAALNHYLSRFDTALAGKNISRLRSFFNDSYEVDDARGQSNWTPQLFHAFRQQRGYDLRQYLPALLQHDTPEKNSRVLYDYRATVDELILKEFTTNWVRWAHQKGKLVRNQSHGSPANILDLYAAVDIPEAEGNDILRFRFASSAANVTGKKLVSAEAATWLNEHFLSGWGDVKKAVDLFFLGGINHIFYHGLAYSPPQAPWPGWLFYAATHFSPANPQWRHFPALNQYVARCQSFLQAGKSDSDLLVYFPLADRYGQPGKELLQHFDGMEKNWEGSGFGMAAQTLQERGYTFDFISDRQLRQLRVQGGLLKSGGKPYKAILLPGNKFLPEATFRALVDLVKGGAQLLVFRSLPEALPGLAGLEQSVSTLQNFFTNLRFVPGASGLRKAVLGKGNILLGDSLEILLEIAKFDREKLVGQKLQFTRRTIGKEHLYFVVNTSDKVFDGWVPFAKAGAACGLFDPATGDKGWALTKKEANGYSVRLQLPPGSSILLKTYPKQHGDSIFPYPEALGNPEVLSGQWKVQFVSGGPKIPQSYVAPEPGYWTGQQDSSYAHFSGVGSYTTTFKREGKAAAYLLHLGKVAQTAAVYLNGKLLGMLTGPVYQIRIPGHLLQHQNVLTIEVANLMANRIRYMDRRGIPWKIFYNINMSAKYKENLKDGLFYAGNWEVQPSGLNGPVTLTPLRR